MFIDENGQEGIISQWAYLPFIQHKIPEIVRNLEITTLVDLTLKATSKTLN